MVLWSEYWDESLTDGTRGHIYDLIEELIRAISKTRHV